MGKESEALDQLELGLRRLRGVLSVGFVRSDDLLVVELQAGAGAYPALARDATRLAVEAIGSAVAVEVVRWGDGGPHDTGARLELLAVETDPEAGELAVRLRRGDTEAVGRAPTAHGIVAAVEATIGAIRTFVPGLPYLPGWARTVETTPDRRFLVVASVTDPDARVHRRGAAEGPTPIDAAARATLAALNRTIGREL